MGVRSSRLASALSQLRCATGRVRDPLDLWVEVFARDNLLTTASAISFQLLTGVAALALLALALLGAFDLSSLWDERIAPAVAARLPPVMWEAVELAVRRVFASSNASLIAFSVVIATWELSGAVRAIGGALNTIYGVDERRPIWRRFRARSRWPGWSARC